MDHFHGSVSENSYYTDRKKCFFGEDALEAGKSWLSQEMSSDDGRAIFTRNTTEEEAQRIHEEYVGAAVSLEEYEGREEAWEGQITVPGNRPGYGVIMGYRLMHSEPCEEMLDA